MAFQRVVPAKLGRGQLSVSPTVDTLYTVPSDKRTIVKNIDICNTSSSAQTVTLYLVPSGDSPADANTLIPTVSLAANSFFQWAGSQVLNEGDTIRATSSGTGITINASGGECT